LQAIPQHDGTATEELIRESRKESFRWAASEIQNEFIPAA